MSTNSNHPKKGSSIKVEPIRDLDDIRKIKRLLKDKPRDLCLFTFGINTAYRAGEILSLRIEQVAHLKAGDRLDVKQSKTKKYRPVTINQMTITALHDWLSVHPKPSPKSALFISRKSNRALSVSAVNRMIKAWCKEVDLGGNYGSHTMRKTWGYHQRIQKNRPIPLLMEALGHANQAQTLEYLCIQDGEISDLYDLEL